MGYIIGVVLGITERIMEKKMETVKKCKGVPLK